MSNPTNWPIVTDGEGYLRHNEKRLLHEQRRPVVGHGNIVGPGFSANANQIDDFNDDVAATNGYFWATHDTPNGPPEHIDSEIDYIWLIHSISRGNDDPTGVGVNGIQTARTQLSLSAEQSEFETEVTRSWRWDSETGTRFYTPWKMSLPYVGMTVNENITATTTPTWYNGAPDDSPFDVPQASNYLYIPSTSTIVFVTVTINLTWSNDVATVFRRLIFWPTFSGSTDSPHAASGGFGQWSHYGQGQAGFQEVYSVTRSWWLYPPEIAVGHASMGVVVVGPEGNVPTTLINSYWQVVR
jgi:hypothetical protein